VDNTAFFDNLLRRVNNLTVALTGEQFWYLTGGAQYNNQLWIPLLIGAPIAMLVMMAWRGRSDWRRSLFLILALPVMLLFSVFTVSDFWVTHMAILMPFPALLIGGALALVVRHFPIKPVAFIAVIFVAGFVSMRDVEATMAYHDDLALTGGFAGHSSAIYKLMDALEAYDAPPPLYAVDWGIQNQVRFLSGGTMQPVDIAGFEFNPDPGFATRVEQTLGTLDGLYIFHAPGDTVFLRREAFDTIIADNNLIIASDEVIHDRSGRPIYHLVRLGEGE